MAVNNLYMSRELKHSPFAFKISKIEIYFNLYFLNSEQLTLGFWRLDSHLCTIDNYISAFCSLTNGQHIYRIDAHTLEECAQKIVITLSLLGAEKIALPHKPEIRT